MNIAKEAWENSRNKEAGDVEWDKLDPEFRAKLNMVVGELQSKGVSTGIAGLEKFEEEVGKLLKEQGNEREIRTIEGVDAGAVSDSQPSASASGEEPAPQPESGKGVGGAEKDASLSPKGTGAQEEKTKEDVLADAAAAGAKVESSETHSPSAPSAARPLAAEAPGNRPTPSKRKAASKSSGKKSGKKRASSKK